MTLNLNEKEERLRATVTPLLEWYAIYARKLPWRADHNPYHVWLSEIMLQQTRVEAVKSYYARFLAALPDIAALAAASEEQLLKLWEGLGYYNRVRNLQRAAQMIVAQHQGEFPRTHAEIAALPGIGPYTAGAIASICFGHPTPAVDGNVLRVVARLLNYTESVDLPKSKQAITELLALIYPAGHCDAFTQAWMDLGATVCIPNGAPLCDNCPLLSLCLGHAQDTAAHLPIRSPKKARRVEQRTVFVFQQGNCIAIEKRPPHGLLAGLWEFPNCTEVLSPEQAIRAAERAAVAPFSLVKSVYRTHAFTHVEWQMTCYHILCSAKSTSLVWVTGAQLNADFALPTAFRQFCDALDFLNPEDSE